MPEPIDDDVEWKKLTDDLTNRLPPNVRGWIDVLGATKRGRRLGICLAIDIHSRALESDLLAGLLRSLSDNPDAAVAFTDALRKNGRRSTYLGRSSFVGEPLPRADRYVRIIEIGSFTEFYGRAFTLTLNPADITRMRYMFLDPVPGSLATIKLPWRGALDSAWVTSQEHLQTFEQKDSADSFATRLNNALGFGLEDGWSPNLLPDFVAILYPPGFDALCAQPTSLDINWDVTHAYLSCGENRAWGRTASCDGSPISLPERVHAILSGLSAEFHPKYIGESAAVSIDETELMKQAYDRLDMDQRLSLPGRVS